ncbi:MAG: hypothetical protein U5K75_12150 [Ahrensia sp.]|nr:hypothetical protein [Ahrensia sp.]
MPKTRVDIASAALRHLGVLSSDETLDANDFLYADEMLDGIFAEMTGTQGLTMPSDPNQTPDNLFLPISRLLSVEIGPFYSVPTETRARAVMRLRAALLADDRKDIRDLDDDGAISEIEADIGASAVYY